MNSFVYRAIVLTAFVLATALMLQAQQPRRVWVSALGDDSLPCSRTAPCKTFLGALQKTVPGSEINCLDAGAFGSVVITKSIAINCPAGLANIQSPSNAAITINVPLGVVRLRGISISGLGTGQQGIRILSAGKVYVEDMLIDAFGAGISVEGTAPSALFVTNSTISNNGFGINFNPAQLSTGSIADSQVLGNGAGGINVQNTDVAVSNCLIAGNATGIVSTNNGVVRLSGNTVSENGTGLSVGNKGLIISYQNNALTGNTTNGAPSSVQPLQ